MRRVSASLKGQWHLLVRNENTSCRPRCFNFHMCSVLCSNRKERADSGQAGALWSVSLRNVQHVGNFMSMFGNFSLIPYSAISLCKQIHGGFCAARFSLDLAMFDLTKLLPVPLVLLVSFPQPRPWGTDTTNPPSLQSAALRERRVPRPWYPSASTRRASRASTSSRACSPPSPTCRSARSASSWRSRWWVDGRGGFCPVIGCCCSVFFFFKASGVIRRKWVHDIGL